MGNTTGLLATRIWRLATEYLSHFSDFGYKVTLRLHQNNETREIRGFFVVLGGVGGGGLHQYYPRAGN
jgi:hypothetical protein